MKVIPETEHTHFDIYKFIPHLSLSILGDNRDSCDNTCGAGTNTNYRIQKVQEK
jgi:hypothetical protein